MEEIIKKYDELYDEMASSKDPRRMMAFGHAEKWIFGILAEAHPELAEKWVSKLESYNWNNYLSKKEAEDITSKLINQDGSHGAHWDYDIFKEAVESFGGKMHDAPFYNCWALWTTVNMLFSDHHTSASEYVPEEMMAKYFYHMALEKLKDADRPKFIRDHFKV